MQRIYCPINTAEIDEVVNKYRERYPEDNLGVNWGYNLVGLYQARYQTSNMPTVNHLYALMRELTKAEVLTALPIFNGGTGKLLPQSSEGMEAEVSESNTIVGVVQKDGKVYTNHSGGAIGADSLWGEIGERYGINTNHYFHGNKTPKGNTRIDPETALIGQRKVTEAARMMYDLTGEIKDPLLIRDWAQVANADAIFAIGSFVEKGEKLSEKKSDNRTAKIKQVRGGTGYTVQMAIMENKPVYVYDQHNSKWVTYDYSKNDWVTTETPVLTPNFAGIGSTTVNDKGVKAIRAVYEKTFGPMPGGDMSTKRLGSKVQQFQGEWSRVAVATDTDTLYIFTDNTDRDSGSGTIPDGSWYARKYGKGHHFPTMTAAVIRGLDNARPISTQRWYHDGAKGTTGRWTDDAFEEFKKVIDDEFSEILKEWNTGKYKRIMFPHKNGLFNTHISNISKERTPKIYEYLQSKYNELLTIVDGNLAPAKPINIWYTSSDKNDNKSLSNMAERPFTVGEDIRYLVEEVRRRVGDDAADSLEYILYEEKFNSVEGAFQAAKLAFTDAYNEADNEEGTNSKYESLLEKFKGGHGPKIKALGKTIEGLDTKSWDKVSSYIMSYLIRQSFMQNKTAFNELISTGDAILTHTQDKGKWGQEFPRILMTTRESLRKAAGYTGIDAVAASQKHAKGLVEKAKDPKMTSISSNGEISLYEIPGKGNKVKMQWFMDFITGRMKSTRSALRAEVFKQLFSKKEVKKLGITDEESFEKYINNYDNAYKIALWIAQSHIVWGDAAKFDSQNLLTQNNVSMEVRALTEALTKLAASKKNFKDDRKAVEGGQYIEQNESSLARLSRDFSPKQREDRIESISRQFTFTVEGMRKELIEDLKKRIAETEKEGITLSTRRKLRELKEDLQTIEDPKNGLTNTINKCGGVKAVEKALIDGYKAYLSASEEENIAYEKSKNLYVKSVLSKMPDADEQIAQLVQHKRDTYEKMIKHFDLLFMESFSDIQFRTGISLSLTLAKTASEEEVDEDGNPIDAEDTEVSYKDGWMTNVRQIDPIRTLTKEIKVLLSDIPLLRNGKVVFTDIGEVKYMDAASAFLILMSETSKLVTDEQFGDATNPLLFLERLSLKYKWVKVLINRVKDKKTGAINNSLLTKLFTALRMQGVYYTQVRTNESGETYWSNVNTMSGEKGILDGIELNTSLGIQLTPEAIYDIGGTFVKENAEKMKRKAQEAYDTLIEIEEASDDEVKSASDSMVYVLNSMGMEINTEEFNNMIYDEKTWTEFVNEVYPEIQRILSGTNDMENGIYAAYRFNYENIVKKIGVIKGDVTLNASFSNRGVQKQSYSGINKIHKIINSLGQNAWNTPDSKYRSLFHRTIEEEYLVDGFFKDANGRIMNYWLRELSKDDNDGKEFRTQLHHVSLDSVDGIPYEDWSSTDVYKAFATKYVNKNEQSTALRHQYALYCMPIFSDSEAAIFIRAPKFTGETFKQDVIKNLADVVKQEIFRINRVKKRAALIKEGKLDPMVNYDMSFNKDGSVKKRNGAEFKFFPQLNDTGFYENCMNLINEKNVTELDKLIEGSLASIMEKGFTEFIDGLADDELAQFSIVEGMSKKALAEEFFYNSVLANTQIIQLSTVDLAFYKNAIDFQKRFKELYAAGTRFNTNSPKGKKIRRAIYLRDQIHPSNSLGMIKKAVDSNPNLDSIAKDYVMSKFRNINATDAQSLLTPTSYSEMLDMLGEWSEEFETALEHFRESEKTGVPSWTGEDFSVIWQTLKPFMYTMKDTKTGLGKEDEVMRSPLQHKNSEFVMLAIFNLVSGSMKDNYSGASDNVTHKALTRFMEKNNIDVAMFESAVKVGGHSFVELGYNKKRFNADKADEFTVGGHSFKADTHSEYLSSLAKLSEEGKISETVYQEAIHKYDFKTEGEVMEALEEFYLTEDGSLDESRVDEFNYQDVMIAQKNPEHLLDTEASVGTQFANIILADLTNNLRLGDKEFTIKEAKNLFNECRVESILDGYMKVKEKYKDKKALSEAVINIINNNPSYSRDLIDAIRIVKAINPLTGEEEEVFNLPPESPSISNQLTQIILSLFKTEITKQHINGGNAVMVSDFGLTDKLRIEHNSDGSVKCIQCFLPAFSRQFFKDFIKEDGTIDIDSIPEDLRQIIGYRIPTEGKYSMAPLKIMGFLPNQNGSVIMLPSDITTLAGSDFDVDKMFLMIKNFTRRGRANRKKFRNYVYSNFSDKIKQWDLGKISNNSEGKNSYRSRIDTFWDRKFSGEKFEEGSVEEWLDNLYEENKSEFTDYSVESVKYDMNKPASEQLKEARDNMMIDIAWASLTSPEGSRAMLTPGNFDNVTDAANNSKIAQSKHLLEAIANEKGIDITDIQGLAKAIWEMDKEEKSDFVSKNEEERWSCSPATFVGFHGENTVGKKMVGASAISTTHQAKMQGSGIKLKNPITLFGITEARLDNVRGKRGNLISSNCAEMSAASVDDAKHHNLKALNLNTTTNKYSNLLLRLGYSIQEVGVILSNPTFDSVPSYAPYDAEYEDPQSPLLFLADSISRTLTGKSSLDTEGMKSIQILKSRLLEAAKALKEEITLCKADSPNGAIDNSPGGYVAQIVQGRNYSIINGGVIEGGDYREGIYLTYKESKDDLREILLGSSNPQLAAFRLLGIESAQVILNDIHFGISENFINIAVDFADELPGCSITKELGNDLFKAYVTYVLSKTKTFGNDENRTMESKRNYYTKVFASNFEKWRKQHKDIVKSNKFLSSIVYDRKYNKLSIPSPKSMSDKEAQVLKRHVLDLFDNPETSHLTYDFLMYSYFTTGLWFGPDSPSFYLMTTSFLINFPEVVEAMRFMKYYADKDSARFIRQFVSNKLYKIPAKTLKLTKNSQKYIIGNAGKWWIQSSRITNALGRTPQLVSLSTMEGESLLRKEADLNSGVSVYVPVDTVPKVPNYNASIEDIETDVELFEASGKDYTSETSNTANAGTKINIEGSSTPDTMSIKQAAKLDIESEQEPNVINEPSFDEPASVEEESLEISQDDMLRQFATANEIFMEQVTQQLYESGNLNSKTKKWSTTVSDNDYTIDDAREAIEREYSIQDSKDEVGNMCTRENE